MKKPKKKPDPTDVHVGARVRMRRIMLEMSQTALADDLGLTFQQVQKYEKGVNRIGAGRLQQIAAKLQVPIPFFYEGLPSAPAVKGTPQGELVANFFGLPHAAELAEHYAAPGGIAERHGVVAVPRAIRGATHASRQAAA